MQYNVSLGYLTIRRILGIIHCRKHLGILQILEWLRMFFATIFYLLIILTYIVDNHHHLITLFKYFKHEKS